MNRARSVRRRTAIVASTALTCALMGGVALGHGLDPAYLSLSGIGDGRYEVTWRTAAQRRPGADVQPVLPARCTQVGASTSSVGTDSVTMRWTVDCGTTDLTGETIAIRDLDAARINALLRIEEQERPTVQVVLDSRRQSFKVPAQPSSLDVLRDYAFLGIEHILGGADHLLFVFGLLLLVPGPRKLLATVTAFTVGHSITLSAAALGLATVPSRPIELLIALSVLALAVDLAGGDDRRSLLRRAPWLMAGVFGLLHGFGFAGALAETGLPAGDIPLALFSFNTGIEIGQLAFVAGALTLAAACQRVLPAGARLRAPAIYAMGILAVFWSLERAAALLS